MLDCMIASHLDVHGDLDLIFEDLRKHVDYDKKEHPIYKILMENKCADEQVIEAFLTALQNTQVIWINCLPKNVVK